MIGQGSSPRVRSPHQQGIQDRLHKEDGVFNGSVLRSTVHRLQYSVAFTCH